MILGITEDFSTDVVLDTELTAIPSTGLYLNSGVHPSITVDNLLSFLNLPDFTISNWDNQITYSSYNDTKNRKNIVNHQNLLYQSISNDNLNYNPDENPEKWLLTNKESLVLKAFIDKVKDKVYSDLGLTKRLVNSQFIYQLGKNEFDLPNDYAGWVFEPKGSDYVSITINQISLQALTNDPINLYVLNQGVLVDTLQITPSNGRLEFKDLNYTFKGKGEWIFAIDSTKVLVGGGFVDPLAYDGFVCYTSTGIGNIPENAEWSFNQYGNGLGFNVSATLDSSLYIDNNFLNFGNFIRATFELMSLQVFLHNSYNRSNMAERNQYNKELLMLETKSLDSNTVAKRYQTEYQRCKKIIDKTFDTQIHLSDDFEVSISSI